MKAEDKTYYKRLAIVGGVIVAIILVIVIISLPKPTQPAQLDAAGQATQRLEKADADVIEAALKVYYIKQGQYPSTIDQLIDSEDTDSQQSLREGVDRLADFDYSVRGDKQAYKITYKSVDKQTVSLEGNYKEDYN